MKGWPRLVPRRQAHRGQRLTCIAQVHAVVAIPLAIKSLQSTILAKDPVFGYDPFVGNALAYSAG